MPKLIIQQRKTDEQWTHDCAESEVTIGRLDTNIVQLRSKGVSRQHAKIFVDGDNFFLTDLKSGNGTFLNGVQLKPQEKNLLRAGDLITIDDFDIGFHADEDAVKKGYDEEVTESDILEVKLLKKVLTAFDKEMVPSLEVLNGAAEGKKIFFTDDMNELAIGRDPECDFSINEYVVSRRHATIIKKWGGIVIRDMDSKNGTFVNNRRVVEEHLHDGDRIALGTIVLLFRNPQEINLAQLSDIKPKHVPQPVSPSEIAGLATKAAEAGPGAQAMPKEEEGATGEFMPEGEEVSALEEWDKLEQEMSKKAPYPAPEAKVEAIKRLTPVEIGMIGLGGLVLIFALITIVNLLAS